MGINFEVKTALIERGFFVADENHMRMDYASGSIANYKKCSISLGHRVFGDIANEWFYMVRFESFAESGQPEVDHHTVTESYIAESKIADFLKSKGIYSKAEIEERRSRIRSRIMRG